MPNAAPAEISEVDIKLKSTTFYSARPFRSAPNIPDSTTKGYRYLEETLFNASITLGKLSWNSQSPEDPAIKERIQLHPASTMVLPLATIHTTTLSVPLALPMSLVSKILPSFDACLISRYYHIELSFRVPGGKGPPSIFTVPTIISLPPPSSSELDVASPTYAEVERLISPPDYSQHLSDDLPAYEPTDVQLVQNDGHIRTFAYVKSEPWLNIHNGFKHGYRKLKGHLEVRQAKKQRDM